ncbi:MULTISPECIES: hypothetical protein [unclassified Rhizobium]|uniref:hypothetical protein n=1 Tax=unclassified Rhizobium TaxID=2613769 RepID=UPI002180D7CC|nr:MULTISPECIES: hypothetical protein [unclassified Rhizobium]
MGEDVVLLFSGMTGDMLPPGMKRLTRIEDENARLKPSGSFRTEDILLSDQQPDQGILLSIHVRHRFLGEQGRLSLQTVGIMDWHRSEDFAPLMLVMSAAVKMPGCHPGQSSSVSWITHNAAPIYEDTVGETQRVIRLR